MNHSKSRVRLRHGCIWRQLWHSRLQVSTTSPHTGGVQAQAVRGTPPVAPGTLAPVDDLQSAVEPDGRGRRRAGHRHPVRLQRGGRALDTRLPVERPRLFGDAPSTVEIRHFGGPLPNGRLMVAAELPVFVRGKEYIVFLRNRRGTSHRSSATSRCAWSRSDGGEVLVNSDGQAVTRVGAGGVDFGPTLFDASATRRFGAKALVNSPAELRAASRSTGERSSSRSKTSLAAQGLTVAGKFADRPAGAFRWRGQPTRIA